MRDTPADQKTLVAFIAAPLKAPERADPTFPDRVMTAVREEQIASRDQGSERLPAVDRPWWRRSVVVRVTPLGALVAAAGIATIILAAADTASRRKESTDVAAQRDTVHIVRFVFVAPGASRVSVAGDFNHWDVNAHPLLRVGVNGVWSASVPVAAGRHEYAFVVDGTRWIADPAAASAIADEFGGKSSVVTVGSSARPRSS